MSLIRYATMTSISSVRRRLVKLARGIVPCYLLRNSRMTAYRNSLQSPTRSEQAIVVATDDLIISYHHRPNAPSLTLHTYETVEGTR